MKTLSKNWLKSFTKSQKEYTANFNVSSCMKFSFFTGSSSATSNLYLISMLMIHYSIIAQFYFMISPKVTLNGRHFSECLCSFCFPLLQRDSVTGLEGKVSPHQECSLGLPSCSLTFQTRRV